MGPGMFSRRNVRQLGFGKRWAALGVAYVSFCTGAVDKVGLLCHGSLCRVGAERERWDYAEQGFASVF